MEVQEQKIIGTWVSFKREFEGGVIKKDDATNFHEYRFHKNGEVEYNWCKNNVLTPDNRTREWFLHSIDDILYLTIDEKRYTVLQLDNDFLTISQDDGIIKFYTSQINWYDIIKDNA